MTPFTHYLRVRYSECDAQAIVFNAKYVEYIDVAATEYMRAMWGDHASILEQGIDNQVVNVNIDWQSSARFDDVVAIEVAVARIGKTSFSLALRFYQAASSQELAIASITYVMVDTQSYLKTPIPDRLRAALKLGAQGQSSNHAGAIL